MAVLTDPISDFLTRWKNASRARKEEFTAPFSRIKAEIARILQEEGYLWSYELDTKNKHPRLKVKIRFPPLVETVGSLPRSLVSAVPPSRYSSAL